MEFKEPYMEPLLAEIADLKAKLETITALVGGKFEPDGSITFNMPKYHAAHRCERHQDASWKEDEEWRECNGCLQDRVDERQEQITRLSEANARLAEQAEGGSQLREVMAEQNRLQDVHTVNINNIVDLQTQLARYQAALAEDQVEVLARAEYERFVGIVGITQTCPTWENLAADLQDVHRRTAEWFLADRRRAAEGKTT